MGELVTLKKKDFESDQEVRWCPGCGDYSILATIQRLLPDLGIPRENHVFVSGIGCASRFPYYMNTYGFHTIHGRAPAIASGLKLANPDLNVWIVSGDGDALSIGGNHFIHLMRRNVNVNFLLFNNRIYGLTKGQYSPTSPSGTKTKSTPYGSLEQPVDPLSLALASKSTFAARALAIDAKGLTEVLKEAVAHTGTACIEILQNCNVFNDGAFDAFAERKVRKEQQVQLQHGKELSFGDADDKVIALDGFTPVVRKRDELGQLQPLIFDRYNQTLATLISRFEYPSLPVPMGVLYQEERPSYETLIREQIDGVIAARGPGDLGSLLKGNDSWQIR